MPVAGQKGLTAGRLAAGDYLVDPCLHCGRAGLLGGCPAALVARERLHQDDARISGLLSRSASSFSATSVSKPSAPPTPKYRTPSSNSGSRQAYTRHHISSSCPTGRLRCPVKQQVKGRLFMILSSLEIRFALHICNI